MGKFMKNIKEKLNTDSSLYLFKKPLVNIDDIYYKVNVYMSLNNMQELTKDECYELYYLLRDISGTHQGAMLIISMMRDNPVRAKNYFSILFSVLC